MLRKLQFRQKQFKKKNVNVFFTKIWFAKTLTRIVKYDHES